MKLLISKLLYSRVLKNIFAFLAIMIEDFSTKTKMLMQLYFSRLSEKDRRHYAALEALRLGRGGITYISDILEVDRGTILQGIKELTSAPEVSPIPEDRQRRSGGGRKKN